MEQQTKIRFIVNLIFTFSVILIVYVSTKFLTGYLMPFVIATFVAWLVQKPAELMSHKTHISRSLCAVFLAVGFFLVLIALAAFLSYSLLLGVKEFLDSFPNVANGIATALKNIKIRFGGFLDGMSPGMSQTVIGIGEGMLESLSQKLTEVLSSLATSLAKRTPSFLFNAVVTLVASCYIAKDFEKLVKFIRELCGKSLSFKIGKIKKIFLENVLKLLRGDAILLLITFAELWLGFWILKVNQAFLLAVIVAIIDLLPVFGTGTVLIPWGIFKLLLGDSAGFLILVLYIVITLVRNFIEPKIIGKQIGINPLFTLLVMFIGLKLMGFLGLIVFPMAFIVVFKYFEQELEEERKAI